MFIAQACHHDLPSGATNCIMYSLHAEDVSKSKRIIAGNELSYLQQIQGGQQIGEETTAINGSRIPRIPIGNQLAIRRLTCVGGAYSQLQNT